jgi:hypothetical protein
MKANLSVFVCPNCKKEISEYAMECPNCGLSLDSQRPIKLTRNKEQAEREYRKSSLLKLGVALLAVIGSISLFVFAQALLAINVYKGISTYYGLILFRKIVVTGTINQLIVPLVLSSILLITSIVLLVVCIIKLFHRTKLT